MDRVKYPRGVPQMIVGAEDHAGPGARLDHRACVGERQRQRLFAQHMLAGSRRGQGLGMVQLVGSADVDRIDRRIGEQRAHVVVGLGNASLCREPGAAFCIAARQRDHLAVGLRADRIDHPFAGDGARPDQPPAHSFVHVFCPGPSSARARSPRRLAGSITATREICSPPGFHDTSGSAERAPRPGMQRSWPSSILAFELRAHYARRSVAVPPELQPRRVCARQLRAHSLMICCCGRSPRRWQGAKNPGECAISGSPRPAGRSRDDGMAEHELTILALAGPSLTPSARA
jgi:hypothetical protein